MQLRRPWSSVPLAAVVLLFSAQGLAIASPADSEPTADASSDDDDDFDAPGPVDRKPRISGVLAASHRTTLFDDNKLPDGEPLPDEYTFQVEHTHLKFSGDLTEKLSWEVLPCVTHMNGFSVITAHFSYEIARPLHITFGRFLLPFGQFNVRSLPGSFGTVSRPLLYQSHEDRTITVAGATPRTFIFSPRDDTGVLASGSLWFGADDTVQLSYSAYFTNGLRGTSDTMARFWDDNNNGKQLGGRISLRYNGSKLTATIGASGLTNQYERSLAQRAWGVDFALAFQYATARRVSLRGEWVDTSREIVPNKELDKGDAGTSGAYVTVEAAITDTLGVFYQFDTLTERVPHAMLNEGFRDLELTTNRHVAGVSVALEQFLHVRLEYGRWLEPLGVPNAHRVSLQTIVSF